MKSITVRVDDDLHSAIRHVAYIRRVSINALIVSEFEWARGIDLPARAGTSVEDKANARVSLTRAVEGRDA